MKVESMARLRLLIIIIRICMSSLLLNSICSVTFQVLQPQEFLPCWLPSQSLSVFSHCLYIDDIYQEHPLSLCPLSHPQQKVSTLSILPNSICLAGTCVAVSQGRLGWGKDEELIQTGRGPTQKAIALARQTYGQVLEMRSVRFQKPRSLGKQEFFVGVGV